MNIIVTINAPAELANAIVALASAFSAQGKLVVESTIPSTNESPVQTSLPPQTPFQPQFQPQQTMLTNPVAPYQPVPPAVPTTPPANVAATDPAAAVPTSTPTYTMDQLAVAATQLVEKGQRDQVVALLGSFGVQALTALPKEQYGAFATQLRAMGAMV